MPAEPPALRGLNHLTLSVARLDRAWTFWVEGLGCRPLMRSPRSAYLLAGDLWLCLVAQPERVPAPATDYTHVAFSVAPDALGALTARALAHGGRIFQDNTTEGASAYLRCPDGHQVELHVGDWRSRIDAMRAAGSDAAFFV